MKLTNSLESSTRKKIDSWLNELGWNTDEDNNLCNIFTERAKTKEQNSRFKRKKPDYVLYKSGTDEPIAIIEAKRKGQSMEEALNQAIERYAKPLGVFLVFATDGTFVKTIDLRDNKSLIIDGEQLRELISEKKLIRFLLEGSNIEEVTPEIKHTRGELIRIFKYSNDLLREEGLRNLDRFVEFSNILFIKIISEIENDKEERGLPILLDKSIRWESFKDMPEKEMLNYINNVVLKEGLAKEYNHTDDIFQEKLKIKNPKAVKEIVNRLSKLTLINTESEIKGDAFEYFLKSLASGNDLGEYFTPRHIIKLIVKLINPKYGNIVFDPFCGTGGFLIEAFRHLKRGVDEENEEFIKFLKEKSIFGVELTDTYKIAKMNMIITGDGHNNIVQDDTAKKEYFKRLITNERNNEEKINYLKNLEENGFDIILSNIPYSQPTKYGNFYPIISNNGDSIFIQHIIEKLSKNGKCAVIVPEGFLAKKELTLTRKYLLETCNLEAIISLPQGVFLPYTGAKTNILFFKKGTSTKNIWYFNVENDGFELNVNRRKIIGKNDIDEIIDIWEEKKITDKSWFININELDKKTFNLVSFNKKTKVENKNKVEKLGNYAIVEGGFAFKSKDYVKEGISLIRIGDIKDGYVGNKDLKKLPNGYNKDYQRFSLEENDILIAMTGATIGKVGIVTREVLPALLNQRVGKIVLKNNEILKDYLYYVVTSDYFKSEVKKLAFGTAQPNISPKQIEDIKIPIVDKKIQKEIIKELRNRDEYINEMKKKIENLKKDKIKVLDKLFE